MGGAKLKKGTEFSSLMYHLDHALQVPTMFYSQQLPSDLTSTEFLDKATNKTSNLFMSSTESWIRYPIVTLKIRK
jgi:hypothetical protein